MGTAAARNGTTAARIVRVQRRIMIVHTTAAPFGIVRVQRPPVRADQPLLLNLQKLPKAAVPARYMNLSRPGRCRAATPLLDTSALQYGRDDQRP